MLEIFKELFSEISTQARIVIFIGLFIFFALLIWACICSSTVDKQDQTSMASLKRIGRQEVFKIG